jgi:hypothetical protein
MKVIILENLARRKLHRLKSLFGCFSLMCICPFEILAQSLPSSNEKVEDTLENEPRAFKTSYAGIIMNQNHPWSYGLSTWSKGGQSWGLENRYVFKDTWTLAISGSFKRLQNINNADSSIFIFSQESLRLYRLYHPVYLGFGGRLSSFIPVQKISIPYDRDPNRPVDTGTAICFSAIWAPTPNFIFIVNANRWRSFSTLKQQGVEVSATALMGLR